MPPKLGGLRIQRALTAAASAMTMFALTLVGGVTNAPRSFAAEVTRSSQLSATASAYTDSKHRSATHINPAKLRLGGSRYASYFSFGPATPNDPEQIVGATVTVTVKSLSHAKRGRFVVRPILTGWTGAGITYRSRPSVGPVLGTARPTGKGTVSITLDPTAAAPYLQAGSGLQVTRAGTKYPAKLAAQATLTVNFGTGPVVSVPQAAQVKEPSVLSDKPVFAHYFPPFPVSLDNKAAASDYYATQYLLPGGESSKFAWCGGLLRDRPEGRAPLAGDFWSADLRTEVNQARAAGITGFAVDILTFDTAERNWTLVDKLAQVASEAGDFSVMLQPDMSALSSTSTSAFAAAIARLAGYSAVYRDSNGAIVVSPFLAEAKTPTWYADALSLLKSQYGIEAVLLPVFLDASNMNSYASVSIGFGNWGIRNPAAAASWPNWAAKAHALGKQWMEPVAVQDVRPNQQLFDEADATGTLAATWDRAIGQDADLALMTTWNDYSEGTSFAPSADHGWAFLDLNKYYLTKFRTGAAKIGTEKVFIVHRIQKVTTPVAYSATMKLRSGSTAPRDKVQVVTLLTAPASVTVVIGGETFTYEAAEGLFTKSFDLKTGVSTASVSRSGSTVLTVTTKDAASFDTTLQQDLSYHAVVSGR